MLPPIPKADLGASADFAALFDAPPSKGDDTTGADDAALPPPGGVLPPKAHADFGAEESSLLQISSLTYHIVLWQKYGAIIDSYKHSLFPRRKAGHLFA